MQNIPYECRSRKVSQWNDLKPFETIEKKPLDNVHFMEFVYQVFQCIHTPYTIESINTLDRP